MSVQRLLDVADVRTIAVVLVDEAVNVAELHLHRRLHVVEADDLAEVLNDLQTAFDLAPVVVGQFQDEKIFEKMVLHVTTFLRWRRFAEKPKDAGWRKKGKLRN